MEAHRHESRQLAESGHGVGRALALGACGVELRHGHSQIPLDRLREPFIGYISASGPSGRSGPVSGPRRP